MLPIYLLLVTTTCTSVGTAILEKVGEADLDAVRIRLEEEKAKRLLLENDVEVLMVQVEELKRGFSQISKDHTASSGNVTFIRASIAFTATLSKETTYVSEQTVIFDNVKANEGNCYDSSIGRFRAPFRGLYIFSLTILKTSGIVAAVGTAILEFVGQADLDAVRIRLEEEKAKRLLLQNDVEVLMLQVEELNRKLSYVSKDSMAVSGNLTSSMPSIAFTATLSQHTTHASEQIVIFDNVRVNEGKCYNSSTGKFRAPFHGLYIFSLTVLCAGTDARLLIMKDDVEVGKAYSGPDVSADSGTVMVVTVMENGQFAYVKEYPGLTETMHGADWATFTGLLHARYNKI